MSSPRPAAICVLLAAIGGCGGKTTDLAPSDSGDHADVGLDGATTDSGVDAPPADANVDATDDAACTKTTSQIAKLIDGRFCAGLVRLSTIDLSVLGWSVVCGPLKVATEADARAIFAPYAGEYSPVDTYTSVGPGGPTDDFVFFHSPGDFGGLGIVSLSTSKLVFAGELSWSAMGSIRYPTTFHSASEAPSVCTPRAIGKYTVVNPGGGPSDPTLVDPVLKAADATAIKRGIEAAGHAVVHQLVVYFPVDGAPESGPAKNEWLVVYDSGLLD